MTDRELVALTEEQIQFKIDYAIAEAGIKPVERPTPPAEITPVVADQIAYRICGILFKDKKDADYLAQASVITESYDYNIGYENKWLEPQKTRVIEELRYPTREAIMQRATELKNYGQTVNVYNSQQRAYTEFFKKTEAIRNDIWIKIRDAKDRVAFIETTIGTYKHYLKLASGEEAIAMKFFVDAYNKETLLVGENAVHLLEIIRKDLF